MKIIYILEILIWVAAITFLICWFNNLWLMILYIIPVSETYKETQNGKKL